MVTEVTAPTATIGDPGAALTARGLADTYTGGIDVAERTCTVGGCDRPYRCKGYCGPHYRRWQRYGDPLAPRPSAPTIPAAERFWEKVDRRGADECWEWQGARLQPPRGPYGRFWTGEREAKAHRFSYELHVGPIPAGLLVCHSCDNPPCVNPAHLFVGTNDDNMADKWAKGRNCYGDRNGSRTHPESRHRGETSPVAKLSDDEARRIYRRYHENGATQVALAAEFGVSQAQISVLVRASKRYTWLAQ